MSNVGEWLSRSLQYLGPSPYLQAAVAVLLCLVLAAAVDALIRTVLRRSLKQWPDLSIVDIGRAARAPVFFTVLLLGLMSVVSAVSLAERPAALVASISKTLLILAWVLFGIRVVRIVLTALGRRPVPPSFAQPTTATLWRNIVTVLFGMIGLYAIFLAWDVNITGLVASAGILGLALSLAAQDTLGNLVAGIAILTDKPYRIGDYIVLDSGERGEVTAIGLRSTRLLTRDDEVISIPNGVMGRAKIVNESGSPQRKYRVRVPVRVGYGTDIDRVMGLMLAAATAHPQVAKVPQARTRLRGFADYGLDFEILVWIDNPANRGLVLHEINCEIYRIFTREGIRMPIPRQEIHLTEPPPIRAAGRPAAKF
jgi:small-conductance mechanosensitive channel